MMQIQRSPLSISQAPRQALPAIARQAPVAPRVASRRPNPKAPAPAAPEPTPTRRKRTVGTPHPIGITAERAAARLKTAHLPGDAPVGPLDQADFSALMHEVVYDVREATGWRIAMPQHYVRSRAEVAQSLCDELPVDAPSSTRRAVAAHAAEFAEHTYAYYEPSSRKVVLVRDNVRHMNYDALRSILHHELVHTAQHQRYPQFLELANRIQSHEASDDPQERALAGRFYYSVLKLIEGHAHLLEMRSRTRYYPQAQVTPRAPSWLDRLFRGRSEQAALQAFLQSPCAGALELQEAEAREPLHTVLKRLYGDLKTTLQTFRTPEERRAIARAQAQAERAA